MAALSGEMTNMPRTKEEIAARHAEIKAGFNSALPPQMREQIQLHITERRGELTRITVRRIIKERREGEGSATFSD